MVVLVGVWPLLHPRRESNETVLVFVVGRSGLSSSIRSPLPSTIHIVARIIVVSLLSRGEGDCIVLLSRRERNSTVFVIITSLLLSLFRFPSSPLDRILLLTSKWLLRHVLIGFITPGQHISNILRLHLALSNLWNSCFFLVPGGSLWSVSKASRV